MRDGRNGRTNGTEAAFIAAFMRFFVLDCVIMACFASAMAGLYAFDLAPGHETVLTVLAVIGLVAATAAAAYASGFIRELKNKVNDNAR